MNAADKEPISLRCVRGWLNRRVNLRTDPERAEWIRDTWHQRTLARRAGVQFYKVCQFARQRQGISVWVF